MNKIKLHKLQIINNHQINKIYIKFRVATRQTIRILNNKKKPN